DHHREGREDDEERTDQRGLLHERAADEERDRPAHEHAEDRAADREEPDPVHQDRADRREDGEAVPGVRQPFDLRLATHHAPSLVLAAVCPTLARSGAFLGAARPSTVDPACAFQPPRASLSYVVGRVSISAPKPATGLPKSAAHPAPYTV